MMSLLTKTWKLKNISVWWAAIMYVAFFLFKTNKTTGVSAGSISNVNKSTKMYNSYKAEKQQEVPIYTSLHYVLGIFTPWIHECYELASLLGNKAFHFSK